MTTNREPYRIDCHVHTVYSGHGQGSVEQVCKTANDKGLATVALTEHLTMPEGMDPTSSYSMNPEQSDAYHREILAMRDRYPEMDIVYGGEADWLGEEEFLQDICKGYDYLLGSIHFIDGWAYDDPDNLSEWSTRDVDSIWNRYLELWCDAAMSKVPFTCMSHPDLPKKFGIYPSFPLNDYYEEMAACASEAGVGVELNSSGLRKPVSEQYPSLELLKTFHEHDVPCCLGSDAHAPKDIAASLDDMLVLLIRAGYEELYVPKPGGGTHSVALDLAFR